MSDSTIIPINGTGISPSIGRNNTAKVDLTQQEDSLPKAQEPKSLLTQKQENIINYLTNGGAALFNLFTFVEGNWGLFGFNNDWMEKISVWFSKMATGTQGVIGAFDTYKKQNLIPYIGFLLEVPVAIFASGYNLWLARGLTQGWTQLHGTFKRRELTTKDGKEKYIGDDCTRFGGWIEGVKINLRELPKIVKEIFTKPFEKKQSFPRAVFTCSFFQIIGALTAFCGLEKIGAGIRDFWGALVDFAFMLDPGPHKTKNSSGDNEIKNNQKKGGASYVPAGMVWVGAAVVDFVKRFTDRIANLTQLSLFFDRLASVFYVLANLDSSIPESDLITKDEWEESNNIEPLGKDDSSNLEELKNVA